MNKLKNFPTFVLSSSERSNNNSLNSFIFNGTSNQILKEYPINDLEESKTSKVINRNEQNNELNDAKFEENENLFKLDKSSDYLLKYFFTSIVQFARSIPFYNLISHEDQILLLKNCWHELFILSLTQSKILIEQIKGLSISSLCESESFSVEPNSSSNENNYKKKFYSDMNPNLEILGNLQFQIEKIRLLNLTNEEFCYLKAILLFNPGEFNYSNSFVNVRVTLVCVRVAITLK